LIITIIVYDRGGTEVTVRGGSLNSVAEPRITLTVVITRFNNVTGSSTSVNTDTRSEVLLMMTYYDDDGYCCIALYKSTC